MLKLKMFLKSFYKNVIVKRKYRSFAYLLIDKDFREDLNTLHNLTKNKTAIEIRDIPWEYISKGHKIIYPKYEKYLLGAPMSSLSLIRVVACPNKGNYLVVDGNHRLERYIRNAQRTNGLIKCEVMV